MTDRRTDFSHVVGDARKRLLDVAPLNHDELAAHIDEWPDHDGIDDN